jgi:cytochrome b6-f complex iron-sulfur subunit
MTPLTEAVAKVWIDDGCILCDVCETACSDVFEVSGEACAVRPEAGASDFVSARSEQIFQAAEGCPVEVIKTESTAAPAPTGTGAAAQGVSKVWIAEGCIVCDVCETACEAVFEVADNECRVRSDAADAVLASQSDAIMNAAGLCPVEVIKFEAAARSAPAKPAAAAKPKQAAAKKPAAAVAMDPKVQRLLDNAAARGGTPTIQRQKAADAAIAPAIRMLKDAKLDELPADARAQALIADPKRRKAPTKKKIDRRDFALTLGWSSFALAGALGGGAIGIGFMAPKVSNAPPTKIKTDKLERFMEPGVYTDYKEVAKFWLVRFSDKLVALSTTCTHLGCTPFWLQGDNKFKCPCHGSGFTGFRGGLTPGINFEGPAPRPLERFMISIQDGVVLVDKGRKFQEELGQWDDSDSYVLV